MTNENENTEEKPVPPYVPLLKHAVKFAYDMQQLRIQEGNRGGRQADHAPALLDEKHKLFFEDASDRLKGIEKDCFKEVGRLLKQVPIYNAWLKDQKGVGPAMAGVLVSSIDIEKCNTVSQLWAWCGLAVVDGEAQRRKKGEKARYNPWLKAKVVAVLGGCLLKANSQPWREFYDNYKNRKANTTVDVCKVCKGEGTYTTVTDKTKKKCYICDGATKPGPYPWAKSDAHLHQASMRYMVKMFLKEMHVQWRTLEGLPVRPSYAEEYLGKVHHEK